MGRRRTYGYATIPESTRNMNLNKMNRLRLVRGSSIMTAHMKLNLWFSVRLSLSRMKCCVWIDEFESQSFVGSGGFLSLTDSINNVLSKVHWTLMSIIARVRHPVTDYNRNERRWSSTRETPHWFFTGLFFIFDQWVCCCVAALLTSIEFNSNSE